MKIELANVNKVSISKLNVGETFLAIRKSEKTEMAVYMKVDKNSGVFIKTAYPAAYSDFAVNLESGQVRKFSHSDLVTPISMKVVSDD